MIIKILLIVVLLGAIFQGILTSYPAGISDEQRKDSGYQAMWEHLKFISTFPHETGSFENIAVAGYIRQYAEQLGLEVERFPFTVTKDDMTDQFENFYGENMASGEWFQEMLEESQHIFGKHMENILVKVDCPKSEHAIMFVAHYDSVATSFGAADDGLAVACMMELMRYFSENPPDNDIYLLFTDAEEIGLMGARNFVSEYPEYRNQVDVLFNFEARGNAGVLTMFESSANNFDLALHLQKSVPYAHSFSLATAIYEQMPNGTDFSAFKNAGYLGMNFAMIDGSVHYHQPSDSWNRLNEDSAWHYYQTILALGSYFGNIDMRTVLYEREAIIFPVFPGEILVLPDWIGQVLCILTAVLAFRLILWTLQRRDQYPYRIARRIMGIFLLGAVPVVVEILFSPGSYLLSIPALLLVIIELIRMYGERQFVNITCFMMLLTLYITTILYVPIVFMVHLAMGMPLLTSAFILIPIIPLGIYIRRVLSDIDLEQSHIEQNDTDEIIEDE